MKRIAFAAFSTLAALVLLFSYPTSTGQSGTTTAEAVSSATVVTGGQPGGAAIGTGQGPDPVGTGPSTTGAAPTDTAQPTPSATTGSTSPAPETLSTAAPVTVNGAQEMTHYGIVQVQVVITGGAITDVTALEYPQTERKDIQINNRALPLLRAQVLSAQSAHIDGVSGATFTTDGYRTSLQSALDAAGFAS